MFLNYNCTVGWFEFIVGKFVNHNRVVGFVFILVGATTQGRPVHVHSVRVCELLQ